MKLAHRRSLGALLPLSSIVLAAVVLSSTRPAAAAKQPNLILMIVDELGTGDVPWADTTIVAPTLQKLGEEGLRLGTQYAWQWCAPTRGSLLSGRFPMHTGYTGGGMPGDGEGMELKWPLLPAELKAAGYVSLTHACVLAPLFSNRRAAYGDARRLLPLLLLLFCQATHMIGKVRRPFDTSPVHDYIDSPVLSGACLRGW